MNGILLILRTGAQWRDLPERYPPYQTVHRWFQTWVDSGVIESILNALAQDLFDRGKHDLRENYLEGSFASAKKRGLDIGKTKRGKGTKIMAIADRHGLPIAIGIASASPHEVTLVEDTIENRFNEEVPERIVADKAYESDPLDDVLMNNHNIELIAPHKSKRVKAATQDGRPLRRYRNRWQIERLFAWLQNFRRLVVRYEYHSSNFLGIVRLGCMLILLRHF